MESHSFYVNDSKPKEIFSWEGMPDFDKMSRIEAARWYEKQRKRWEEGYGGLNGIHYFYATIGTLKNARNKYIKPRVRDGDILVFEAYIEAQKRQRDLFIAKRRGFALSSIFGAGVPFYHALLEGGSVNLMTSADQKRLNALYRDKIMPFYNGLPDIIKPGVISGQQKNLLHLGSREGKTVSGLDSLIMGVPTAGSYDEATAFEAYRATSIFIDEVFLHDYAKQVLASAQASISDDLVKINPIVMGGSCGVASSKAAVEMQALWEDSVAEKVLTVFIPGTMCVESAPEIGADGEPTGRILNFCENGISDQKRAEEWIDRTREIYDKATNKTKLYQFIKAYPKTIGEVFEFNTVGAFSQDVMDALTDISTRITKQNDFVVPVRISEAYEGGAVRATPIPSKNYTGDKSGFFILKNPEPNVIYGLGNDPIPFTDNSQDGKRSDLVSIVARMDTAEPVAYYRERTHDPDIAVENTLLLSRLYNDAKIMIEMNQGGVLSHKIRDLGFKHLLAPQPICFGGGVFKKREGYGWWKGTNAQEAYAELVRIIKTQGQYLNMKDLVDELKKFLVVNTDLADAYVSFLVYRMDYLHRKKAGELRPKIEKEIPQAVWRNGRLVTEWVKVYVDAEGVEPVNKNPSSMYYGR
jgi:hypothetical protein